MASNISACEMYVRIVYLCLVGWCSNRYPTRYVSIKSIIFSCANIVIILRRSREKEDYRCVDVQVSNTRKVMTLEWVQDTTWRTATTKYEQALTVYVDEPVPGKRMLMALIGRKLKEQKIWWKYACHMWCWNDEPDWASFGIGGCGGPWDGGDDGDDHDDGDFRHKRLRTLQNFRPANAPLDPPPTQAHLRFHSAGASGETGGKASGRGRARASGGGRVGNAVSGVAHCALVHLPLTPTEVVNHLGSPARQVQD